MAGRGPAPKPLDQRQRRNADPNWVELDPTIRVKAPPMPRPKPRTKWLASTKAWWETWATSPQAQEFTPTDWLRLQMLVPLVDAYFREPDTKLMSEIRQNEAKLGATREDMLRNRWTVRKDDPAPAATATAGRKSRRDPRLTLVEGGA